MTPRFAMSAPSLRENPDNVRVLLVEDNKGDVELVRDAILDLPASLDVVNDGEQALAYLRRDAPFEDALRPQVVLLDLKLPRMDGLEVLDELSRDPDLRRIPVVVLTSSQAPRDLARAYELNALACFAKAGSGLRSLLDDTVRFVRRALPVPEGPTIASAPRVSPEPQRPTVDDLRRARQLAALVDSTADAIIGTSRDGRINSWNRAAEALYGRVASDAIGQHFRIIVPEERAGELDAMLQRALSGGTEQRIRTLQSTREGLELHVACTLSPIRDSLGTIIGASAVARDVTEQAQAEERFRLAVEASPSAMLMVDTAGKIVMMNAEAERLFGYERNELMGQAIDMLVPRRFRDVHPDHRSGFMSAPRVRAMGAGRELYGVRKDGTEVPVEIGLNPITTADGVFVLSSIVDITERRQAEENFRLAVEASPSGIVMVDDDGTIVLVNAETERMFGYGRGELIGDSVDRLVPVRFRGTHAHHRRGFGVAPEARTMGTGRDLFGLRKDGTEFPVEVGLNPIDAGQGRRTLSTIVDITARKQAEEAMAVQATELARSNEELEQFAYAASHDLQEPLRMVSGYTELLAERYGTQLDEAGKRYIDYAQDGANRMRGLIDDLLAYSRVRSRGQELVAVSASTAMKFALMNLRSAIRECEAEIDTEVDAVVLGDETQLTQVFQNLISNSLKFRQDETPRIVVTSRRDQDKVVFAVADNGIGIDPKYGDRVFQMFERLHTRDEYSGSGIGLALCRRIIERHGGRIWVESDGEQGSTFLFTLKAAPGHAA